MCFRSTPPPSDTPFDTCGEAEHPFEDGKPSWPLWMAAEANDDATMEKRLRNPNPGRDVKTALVYLGWVIHIMQDLAVPAHQADVHGDEVHTKFEDDVVSSWKHVLDMKQLNQELMNDTAIKQLLESPPKNLRSTCNKLGWSMEQPFDHLGVNLVISEFEKTASLNLPLKNGQEEYKKAIVRSIRDTILMLGCFADKVESGACPKTNEKAPPAGPNSVQKELRDRERIRQYCAGHPNSSLCGGGIDIDLPGHNKPPVHGDFPGPVKPPVHGDFPGPVKPSKPINPGLGPS